MSAIQTSSVGARDPPEGARKNPEGKSISVSTSEVSQDKKKIQTLEIELKKEREAHNITKSNSQTLDVRISQLLRENQELRDQLNRFTAELNSLRSQSETRPLDGTPDLIIENNSDSQLLKNMQRMLPQLRACKSKISQLYTQLNHQNEVIKGQRKQLESKFRDTRRPAASTDSTSGRYQYGPSTTMALTLSLSQADKHVNNYSERPVLSTASEIDKHKQLDSAASALRFDRHGPVENSNNEYGNTQELMRVDHSAPQTLVSSNISKQLDSGMQTSNTRRSTKAPKPMPRSRVPKQPPSRLPSESILADSYEIVDRPAAVPNAIPSYLQVPRTLNRISEQPANHSSNQSAHSDLPLRLSNHVVPAPFMEHHPSSEEMTYLDATANSQECTVCNTKFPQLPRNDFEQHCLECAEKAADEEMAGVPFTVAVTESNLRICPLCQEKFGPEVSQTDYESHVQQHFPEDDTREAGWESVNAP